MFLSPNRHIVLMVCAVLLSVPSTAANPVAVACDATAPCRLDGDLNKAIWRTAPVFDDFVEKYPRNGGVPKFRTTYQVAYDSDAVLFAIHAYDDNPGEIRSVLARHDTLTADQDYVTLLIDPIGNKKFAQFFRISAAGATADGLFSADSDTFDLAPDFMWDAVVRPTPHGFDVEVRIPFSSLRYSNSKDSAWRVMVGRITPRAQRHVALSVPMPNDAPNFISTIQALDGLKQPSTPRFLQFKPALTLRRTTDDDNGVRVRESKATLGLDVKMRPFANVVLDATIKPDFSQVEIDEPQLNRNVQFALSTQEKRPFFLESNDLLVAPTSAVYTRTISNPQWGLRATVRNDATAGTLFSARDDGGGIVLLPSAFDTGAARQPASQASVARGFWNAADLSLNALLSHRDYRDHGVNTVGGVGATWQLTAAQRVRVQWLRSHTTALPDAAGELRKGPAVSGNDVFVDYLHRTDANELAVTLVRTDDSFRNDNGFYSQSGHTAVTSTYTHSWRSLSWINELQGYLTGTGARTLNDGETINYDIAPGLFLSGSNGLEARLEPHLWGANRVAAGSPIIEPRYWHGELAYSPAPWMPKVTVNADVGKLVDYNVGDAKRGRRIALTAKMQLGRHIELSPSVENTNLRDDSSRVFSETLWRVLGIYHFDERNALRLIAQSHRGRHVADPRYALEAFRDVTEANSVTYIRRPSSNSVLYAGYTERLLTAIGARRTTKEFFAKIQMTL